MIGRLSRTVSKNNSNKEISGIYCLLSTFHIEINLEAVAQTIPKDSRASARVPVVGFSSMTL